MHKSLVLVTMLVTALNPLYIRTAAQEPSINELWENFKTSLNDCVNKYLDEYLVAPIKRIPTHIAATGQLVFNTTKNTLDENKGKLALAATAVYATMRYLKNASTEYEQINQLTKDANAIESLQVRCFIEKEPQTCFISEKRNNLTDIITALETWFTNQQNHLETTHIGKTLVMQITVELQRPLKSKKRLLKTFKVAVQATQNVNEVVTSPTLISLKEYLFRTCTPCWNTTAQLHTNLPNESTNTIACVKIMHTTTLPATTIVTEPRRFLASDALSKLELLRKTTVFKKQLTAQTDRDAFKTAIKNHLSTLVTDDDLEKTITIEISYRDPQTHLVHFLKPVTFAFNGKNIFKQHQYNTEDDEQYTFKNYFIGKRSAHYTDTKSTIVNQLFNQHVEPMLALEAQQA